MSGDPESGAPHGDLGLAGTLTPARMRNLRAETILKGREGDRMSFPIGYNTSTSIHFMLVPNLSSIRRGGRAFLPNFAKART